MKFKKDGKIFESVADMRRYACPPHMNCFPCAIRQRCEEEGISCPEYVRKYPAEAAHYLGFEVIEDDAAGLRGMVEQHGEDAKPDPVNRPEHYTSGGIECIDAMTAAFGDETVKDFCLCNAFKYLWRHRQKNGVEDLKKARWYLNRLIEEMDVEE